VSFTETSSTADTSQCAVLGYGMPPSWLSRLSIGKKLALSFSLILILLIGSLGASFFYLSE